MQQKKINRTVQMVNVSDDEVTIQLGGAPGDGVTEYKIKPGEAQAFHENYCKPVPGAGRNALPAILERKSMRTYPDGVRRPVLVPADIADKVRKDYDRALDTWKKAGKPAPKPPAPLENGAR